MGRKRKEDLDLDLDVSIDSMPMTATADPVPVKIVQETRVNPDIGKFPIEGEPRPTRRYRFTYNQQPGTPMEFTRGLTCLSKGTLKRKNEFFKYKIEDGEDVELPTEIAEFLMGLTYFEDGRSRPRCTLVPLS